MTLKTPLDIARELWPGTWTESGGNLSRTLYALPGKDITITLVRFSDVHDHWQAALCVPYPTIILASTASLSDVITQARRNAQAILITMGEALDLKVTP